MTNPDIRVRVYPYNDGVSVDIWSDTDVHSIELEGATGDQVMVALRDAIRVEVG